MNIHEFEAKKILGDYGVPVPSFKIFVNEDGLKQAIEQLRLTSAVLKVQVHAGGRGKAGGVKLAKSPEEILDYGNQLMGMKIVNNQTGKDGVVAEKILISAITDYVKEYYLGAIIDRTNAQAVLIASPEGGMDIEEIAEKHPEKIIKIPIAQDGSVKRYHLMKLAKFMGWKGIAFNNGIMVAASVARAFMDNDASLLEINPLVELKDGTIMALDAKFSIDDNALYRHRELEDYYDPKQISPFEAEAKKYDLAYVALDGNIGCMVNGAGLAMATMDLIKLSGGSPANFLDVGGSATREKVAGGFKILLSDKNVKAILVNIFGGIMNCVTISAGIIAAASELEIPVPLIVRLEGTNVEKGKQMLIDSGLNIIIAGNLSEAAEKVVAALNPAS